MTRIYYVSSNICLFGVYESVYSSFWLHNIHDDRQKNKKTKFQEEMLADDNEWLYK